MLNYLTLKIDHLSYAVLNIAVPCNNNTKFTFKSNVRAHSVLGEKMY